MIVICNRSKLLFYFITEKGCLKKKIGGNVKKEWEKRPIFSSVGKKIDQSKVNRRGRKERKADVIDLDNLSPNR